MGLVIMMMLVGLAACGGSGSGSSSGNGVVNLTYALWDQNEQVGYQQSINQFMKLHPKIHVTIQQTPWASYWQKLGTEFARSEERRVGKECSYLLLLYYYYYKYKFNKLL